MESVGQIDSYGPLRQRKLAALVGLIGSTSRLAAFEQTSEHSICASIHGVELQIRSGSEAPVQQMTRRFPRSWVRRPALRNTSNQMRTQIFWIDQLQLSVLVNDAPVEYLRSEDPNPDCDILLLGNWELAIQRDFMAALRKHEGVTQVYIVAQFELEDCFFNALRWLLPRFMLSQKTALMHSSAVVGQDGVARMFLGPSGAGKTTITRLAQNRLVLGDDMNVLSLEENGARVELGFFGQGIESPIPLGFQIPLQDLYFLKQSSQDGVRLLPKTEAARKFAASCANLFWPQMGEDLSPKVFKLAIQVAESLPCYELEFTLSGRFWNYVDGKAQAI